MSLTVPSHLQERIRSGGAADAAEFVATIKSSLPRAWEIFETLAADVASTGASAEHAPKSMDPEQRGQLLRAMASTSIREAIERHFGVRAAFQNCHKTRFFPADGSESEEYRRFTSPEAQLANQSQELTDC